MVRRRVGDGIKQMRYRRRLVSTSSVSADEDLPSAMARSGRLGYWLCLCVLAAVTAIATCATCGNPGKRSV